MSYLNGFITNIIASGISTNHSNNFTTYQISSTAQSNGNGITPIKFSGTVIPVAPSGGSSYGTVYLGVLSGGAGTILSNFYALFIRNDSLADYTGTLTNGIGLAIGGQAPSNQRGSKPTNQYGIYIQDVGGAGVTNVYGLYMDALTAGLALTYAIYTNAGTVSFGGIVEHRVDQGITFINQTSGAAGQAGTLANAPVAGDPAFWLKIKINTVNRFIPCW